MPAGRPKKEIDQKQFEVLCYMQMTKKDICEVLDVSENKLSAWCEEKYGDKFCVIYSQKRVLGKASFRKSFYELAKKNATAAIYVDKSWFNGSELSELDIEIKQAQLAKLKAETELINSKLNNTFEEEALQKLDMLLEQNKQGAEADAEIHEETE
ncbi:MAG: hypothetical protein FWC41_00120 [Firmicutes bacterium]|nr:hypothetical protein [Bacillota bacterium]